MTIWNLIARFVARPAVANWLIQRSQKTPYTHLPRTDDPSYMARYWVFNPYDRKTNKPRWFFCPWSIRVHHIKREDFDRDMHDHPWNARTIILKGWYTESRLVEQPNEEFDQAQTFYRQPGHTAKLGFGEYHTITSVSDGGVWTLFISGPWRGVWGFLVDGVKVPWKTYLGVPEKGDLDDTPAKAPVSHGTPKVTTVVVHNSDALSEGLDLLAKIGINREFGKFGPLSNADLQMLDDLDTDLRIKAYGNTPTRDVIEAPVHPLEAPGEPYHPLKSIAEWRKGCSCATEGRPAECEACTEALINAVERWHKKNDATHGSLIEKLAKADVGQDYTEDECFVGEAAYQMGFECLNDDATVYGCTLGQLVKLMRTYGVKLKGDQ